jgi:predicted dehydrogenase
MIKRSLLIFVIALVSLVRISFAQTYSPLRLGVAGISHGHSGWIFERKNKVPLNVVGIYEPDTQLAQQFINRYQLDPKLFYTDLNKMLEACKPEAVVAFGSIHAHLAAVQACAPKGIHVMVEKPLAVSIDHANQMKTLADKYKIHLLTNYETSWYPTTEKSFQLANDSGYIGAIKKMVIHDGHEGPKEIGVSKEFFQWLTDPVLNGGGAIIDFGCYGANLMTWLMKGQEPVSVTATTHQFKPSIYPKVDDEANIILSYPAASGIIQASWNWPFGRKDMEIYGETGYIISDNRNDMRLKNKTTPTEIKKTVNVAEAFVYDDPFAYFTDVVQNKIKVPRFGLYSLENNMIVVKILELAKQSAGSGRTIFFRKTMN